MEVSPNVSPIPAPLVISQPMPEVQEKINLTAAANGEINLDTVNKVTHYIAINKIKDQFIELGRLDKKLENDIKEIKSHTTGFLAFFRYLFRWGAKMRQEQLAERMQMLRDFIEHIRKAKSEKAQEDEPVEVSEHAVINELKKILDDKPEEVVSVAADQESLPPPPPVSTGKPLPVPPVPPRDPSLAELALDGAPPPPPPPGVTGGNGPPPPPPPRAPKALTEQEKKAKHDAQETKRLARLLQQRAAPDDFIVIPELTKELKEKLEETKELESDINALKDDSKYTALVATKEAKKEKILERIEEAKAPKRLKYSDNKELFDGKVSKYTNIELMIMIGMMYDGVTPSASHPLYRIYASNKGLFDQIFNEWETLSKSEAGKAFLPNSERWKDILATQMIATANLSRVITILTKRLLPTTNRDRLPEPVYEAKAFKKGASAAKGEDTTAVKRATTAPAQYDVGEVLKKREAMLKKAADKKKTSSA